MKKIILILFLSIVTNLVAQKDTIYFGVDWKKSTKEKAKFYRPLPLKKTGNLFEVKDYYSNGKLQMEGYFSDLKKEALEGKAVWYYKNGVVSYERHYIKGSLNGMVTYYNKDGFLRAKGNYKNDKYESGSLCCYEFGDEKDYIATIKNGIREYYKYYSNSDKIAEKIVFMKDNMAIRSFYDRDNIKLGEVKYEYSNVIEGKHYYFKSDDNGDYVRIQGYANYKNRRKNGEAIDYDKNGKIIAKGIYKDAYPYSGTFYKWFNKNHVETYINGILEGEEIAYNRNEEIIAKGVNKKGEPYSGLFYIEDDDYSQTVTYTGGILEGEEIAYNKNGKIITKGINKNGKPYSGLFYIEEEDYSQTLTYTKGALEGEEITYLKNEKIITKGVNKKGEPYTGTFYDDFYNIGVSQTYSKGVLEGEEITFFKNHKEIIARGNNKNDKHWNGDFLAYSYNFPEINTYKNGILKKKTRYYTLDYKIIKEYYNVINDYVREGEEVAFNKKGEVIAKGIYKDNKPWNGSFYKENYRGYGSGLTSYKNGKKHGMDIDYDRDGNITKQQEYDEGKLTGLVKTKGSFKNRICKCQYKKGKPINGEVCDYVSVKYYKNGKIIKEKKYGYGWIEEENVKEVIEYDSNEVKKSIKIIKEDKTYLLTLKNGKPYNGIDCWNDCETYTTYVGGKKNGEFSKTYGYGLTIEGNYKNDLMHGKINYKNGNKKTSCVHVNDIPVNGTVLTRSRMEEYKNGKPINGIFLKDEKKGNVEIVTHTEYVNGKKEGIQQVRIIISNKYHGKDYKGIIYYKNDKILHGEVVEYNKNKIYKNVYIDGEIVKTKCIDVSSYYGMSDSDMIINYNKKGYHSYRSGETTSYELTYSNQSKDSGKIKIYRLSEKVAKEVGFCVFEKGKITQLSADFEGEYLSEEIVKVKYTIEKGNRLLKTLKKENSYHKIYATIDLSKKIDPKDLYNIGELFQDATKYSSFNEKEKPICTMKIKNSRNYDGITFDYDKKTKTYTYIKYKEGKYIEEKKNLKKKELLENCK